MRSYRAAALALVFVTGLACSSEKSSGSGGSTATTGSQGGSGGAGCAASGAGGNTGAVPLLAGDCDPLVPTQCGFPFPSNVFLVDDPTTVTGKRVKFGAETLPRYASGGHVDPAVWSDSDGFSAGQPALTHLPGATITGLPDQDHIGDSILTTSPTILMEADTGKLVPHFAEIDQSLFNEDDADRTFIIRPVIRLEDKTRYIVAIRHVVDKDGKALPPSPVFAALRDGKDSCDVSVARRKSLYDDIFGKLEKAGVDRKDLQIAWDYTTSSRENNTARFLHMRDEALATVGTDGPPYVIDKVEENPNPHIRRRINGHMTVPLYLDKAEPGGKLVLDDKGMPKQNGTADFTFLVHIPNSATTGTPGALLQNGHGLLGYKTEGQDGYLAQIADDKNYVAFGVDMIGMAHDDVVTITNSLVADVGGFKDDVGRQQQGMLNSLLAMRMMKGRFWKDPQVQFNGVSAIDPSQCFYRGDSQGGIFGITYMAVSTDVTRGLLGEPGMPYSLLLNRSLDFAVYFTLMKTAYQTGRNIQLLLGLIQMTWDRIEPDGYAAYITDNPLPNTPSHNVLIHDAIGDYQVTPLGAHLLARTIKATNLAPVNRTIWGIPEKPAPFGGNGMVEFSFGLPESPKTNTAPPDNGMDPHDEVRSLQSAIDQEDTFFRTGMIVQACKDSCDPE